MVRNIILKKTEKVSCSIEHHATLFALLAKYAIESYGEVGKKAVVDGVTHYGEERGKRMSQYAIKNGDVLDLVNNQAYSEWLGQSGEMDTGIVKTEPTFVTYAKKCAWCDAWNKYDLLEYGKYYCLTIDEAVFHGFREDFSVKTNSNLSWGADHCEFDWGIPMSQEDLKRLDAKRKEIGDTYVRDFNYHTSHLCSTLGNEIINKLGKDGKKVIDNAKEHFIKIFGEEYLNAIEGIYK